MSKIQSIKISNFKAIEDLEADFKGCTAIITGGNNKGKTSFLRGIPDRVRFIRPDVIVKKGEIEGRGEMTLTTGEQFVWEFTHDGKDKLTYITKAGLKQSVTVELGKQFFPPTFDIDKFLQSPPKKQSEQLQSIVGLDFTDIDERYRIAYLERTERNREAELFHVKLSKAIKVDAVHPVDLTSLQAKKEAEKKRLNELYMANKKANETTRNKWNDQKASIDKEVSEFNSNEFVKEANYNAATVALSALVELGYSGDAIRFVDGLKAALMPNKKAVDLYPKEPTYIDEMPDRSELDKIDAEILAASETNAKAQKYQEYIELKTSVENSKDAAKTANELVQSIEYERQKMIESANMPKGISITPDGIEVDGFPLDKNQISTSKLYTSALRIASMRLGEVKTLYFDASFLDRNSLKEIQDWAKSNDLQLLIERPDFEGGDIKYEIIETI